MKMNEYLHKKGFPQEIINLIGDYSSKDFKPNFQNSLHCSTVGLKSKYFKKLANISKSSRTLCENFAKICARIVFIMK